MPEPNPSSSALTVLLVQQPPAVPSPAEVMTMTVELPPGDPGTPPHRHAGSVFGYTLEGEMTFELEGEPERVIGAGGSLLGAGRRHHPPPGGEPPARRVDQVRRCHGRHPR